MNAARMLAIVAIGTATVLGGCGGDGGSDGALQNQSPVASFVATPDSGPASLSVQLDASASRDADGSVASYSWNFGDSTPTVAGVTASHTFQAAGTYTVTLTVKDSSGATASMTCQVTVSEPLHTNVDVPDVVGMTQSDAAEALVSAGLNVGTITSAPSETVAAGSVISQSMVSGASVPRHSAVDLVVSSGGGGPPPGQMSLLVEPAQVDLSRGARDVLKVTVLRGEGLDGPIIVRLDKPPAGVIAANVTLLNSMKTAHLPLRVTEDCPLGTAVLTLHAETTDANADAQVVVTVTPAVPTAQVLVASALNAGTIDYATSLVYRVYALFGDPRLPDAFKGSGSVTEDNGVFQEIRAESPSVPPDVLAQLQTFLLRPDNPGSFWNRVESTSMRRSSKLGTGAESVAITAADVCQQSTTRSWMSTRSEAHPVRVWVLCKGNPALDDAKRAAVAKTLGILDKIFGPMTTLMGNVIPDEEGPDSAIDFYLVEPVAGVGRDDKTYFLRALGSAIWDTPVVNNASSSFVLLAEEQVAANIFHNVVIHEFFHVLANTHNSKYSGKIASTRSDGSPMWDQHWFEEASATWAEAHFDRELADKPPAWEGGRAAYESAHWMFADAFVDRVDRPLTWSKLKFATDKDLYSTYIWPFFAEFEKRSGAFMNEIFERMRNVPAGDFRAADLMIDSGFSFEQNFKKFALKNWNQPDAMPKHVRYVSLDETFKDVAGPSPKFASLESDVEYRLALTLADLSAEYIQLEVVGTAVRKVQFDFTGLRPEDLLDVMALIHTSSGWIEQPFDYSNENQLTFCFDDGPTTTVRRGSFDKMVLVLANHSKIAGDKITGTLIVRPESKPCVTLWRGTIERTFKYQIDDVVGYAETQATVTFGFHDPVEWPCTQGVEFCVRQGSFVHNELSDDLSSGCHATVTAAGPILPPKDSAGSAWVDGAASSWLYIYTDPRDGLRYYDADGDVNYTAVFEKTACHNPLANSPPFESAWSFIWWKMDPQLVPNDGQSLVGVYEQDLSPLFINGIVRYEWTLQQVRE